MSLAMPVATDAGMLANLARAFERRVDQLPRCIDASWTDATQLCALADSLPAGAARRPVLLNLFQRLCGPLPSLGQLAQGAGPVAVLERIALLGNLCVTALMGRPGAVRCCLDKRPRQALKKVLGPVFDVLRDSAEPGPALPAHAAAWTPMQWACVGYMDIDRDGIWPHESLRQLVRLALPQAWPVLSEEVPPASMRAQMALAGAQRLLGGESAC